MLAKRLAHAKGSRTDGQAGFTIVELMVATLVFSTILLVVTVGVIDFTNSYYKGVTISTTQNTARAAVETIAQSIQLSGGTVVPTTALTPFFCAAGKVFNYEPGRVFDGSAASKGLYVMPNNSASNCYGLEADIPLPDATATQLLSKNMRITSLTVETVPGSSSLWNVSLSLAYGDPDLLCNKKLAAGAVGGCKAGDPSYDATAIIADDPIKGNVLCKIQTGSQFCAVSSFSTTVQQRIIAH